MSREKKQIMQRYVSLVKRYLLYLRNWQDAVLELNFAATGDPSPVVAKMGTEILLSGGVDILGVAPSPEYITSGDYRSSAADGSAKGPSSRLTVALVSPQIYRRTEKGVIFEKNLSRRG